MSIASTTTGPPVFALKKTRQPMLWAAIAYSLGICAEIYLWRPMLWWIAASILFLAAALYFTQRRAWLARALALGALFLAGAFHVSLRDNSTHLNTDIANFADGDEVQLIAHSTRNGRLQPGSFGEVRQSLDVETEEVVSDSGAHIPIHSGMRLSIYAPHGTSSPVDDLNSPSPEDEEGNLKGDALHSRMTIFHYGDRLRVTAKLKLPRNFRNPGAFDYQSYLASNNIAALGSAKLATVEHLQGFSGSRVQYWRSRMHDSVIAKIHQVWPAREAALIDAMVIGEEAFIDRDTRVDFQRSGTYHVLVVSGMNVSILAFVVFWTLRRLRFSDIPTTLLTIGSCCAYAFLTSVGPPVWRATLMCAIYLCTRLFYRDRAMVNALGAAALGLLILDPRQLFTASFQMTFVCVLIVSAIGLPMLERTSQLYGQALAHWQSADYGRTLPPRVAQFRVDLRMIASRLGRFFGEKFSLWMVRAVTLLSFRVFELFFISAVMQIGLALPMAYYFHRATTIGLPANLAVVPLTELMMPSAIAAVALAYISPVMAKVPALLTTLALHGITGTIHGLGVLHLSDLRVPTPSVVMIIAAAATLALAMLLARRTMLLANCGILALLITSLVLAFTAPQPQLRHGVLEVTSIDISEGDSTLLVTPEGRTLLVDAGGPIGESISQLDFGEDVVSPYLWARGISRLDAVAITHGHSDHIGGMAAVLKNFRPRELWVGLLPPSAALDRLIAEAQSLGTKVVRHWEGDEFNLGGAAVSVLFPPRDWPVGPKPQNNDSLVLRVSYKESSVLLEGDAQKQVERRIAALHHPKVDLLKVGHHGSANATSQELIDAAHPSYAVISVGFRNMFRLPRPEVLQRLEDSGARVYRTDLEGAITFYLDGHSVTPVPAVLPPLQSP